MAYGRCPRPDPEARAPSECVRGVQMDGESGSEGGGGGGGPGGGPAPRGGGGGGYGRAPGFEREDQVRGALTPD